MTDLPYVFAGGQTRFLGCLPAETRVTDWPSSEEIVPLIDEREWSKYYHTDLERFVWMTKDQSNQSSCTGAAAMNIMQVASEMADPGRLRVELSQAVPYALSNGGRDAGSAVDVVLRNLMEYGTVEADFIDPLDWRGYYRKTWPKNWKERGKRHQIIEAWRCPTFEHFVSGLCARFLGLAGVTWGGGGGHAIGFLGKREGECRILNSWGESWGEGNRIVKGGLGWLPDRQVEKGIGRYGAWLLRVVTRPSIEGSELYENATAAIPLAV